MLLAWVLPVSPPAALVPAVRVLAAGAEGCWAAPVLPRWLLVPGEGSEAPGVGLRPAPPAPQLLQHLGSSCPSAPSAP